MSFRHVAYMLNYRSTATADTVISCLQNVHFALFVLYPKWMEKINNITAIEINDSFVFVFCDVININILHLYKQNKTQENGKNLLKLQRNAILVISFINYEYVHLFHKIFSRHLNMNASVIFWEQENIPKIPNSYESNILFTSEKHSVLHFLWFVKNKSPMGINLEYVLVNWVKFLAIG